MEDWKNRQRLLNDIKHQSNWQQENGERKPAQMPSSSNVEGSQSSSDLPSEKRKKKMKKSNWSQNNSDDFKKQENMVKISDNSAKKKETENRHVLLLHNFGNLRIKSLRKSKKVSELFF